MVSRKSEAVTVILDSLDTRGGTARSSGPLGVSYDCTSCSQRIEASFMLRSVNTDIQTTVFFVFYSTHIGV